MKFIMFGLKSVIFSLKCTDLAQRFDRFTGRPVPTVQLRGHLHDQPQCTGSIKVGLQREVQCGAAAAPSGRRRDHKQGQRGAEYNITDRLMGTPATRCVPRHLAAAIIRHN